MSLTHRLTVLVCVALAWVSVEATSGFFAAESHASGALVPVEVRLRRAVELAEEGRQRAELGDYHAAIEDYHAALELSDDPAFLFNLGVLYREVQEYPKAISNLSAYIEAFPNAPNKEAVESMIESLIPRRAAGWGRVLLESAPEGAMVYRVPSRGQAVLLATTPDEIWLRPGHHNIRFEHDGRRSEERGVIVELGETQHLDIPMAPGSRVSLAQNRFPEDGGGPSTAGIVLVSGGATLGISGAVLYMLGRSDHRGADSASDLDRASTLRSRGDTKTSLGATIGGIGVGAAAIGTILLVMNRHTVDIEAAEASPSPRFAISPELGGASIQLSGRFR